MTFVAYDIWCIMMFIIYDVCHIMMFVGYDMCPIMKFVTYDVFEHVTYSVCRSASSCTCATSVHGEEWQKKNTGELFKEKHPQVVI